MCEKYYTLSLDTNSPTIFYISTLVFIIVLIAIFTWAVIKISKDEE